MTLFDLSGRTALVTGGAYGLGRSLALGLAEHGARVIVTARSADKLAGTLEELEAISSGHRMLVGDLMTDPIYDEIAAMEPIDIVVHNAGGDPYVKPWPHQTPQEWRETYEINVVAAMRLAHLLTPGMMERGWGRLINISSIYGFLGQDPRAASKTAGAGAYTAAKHGLIGLTRYLAAQLSHAGVTVNAVSPGMIAWRPSVTEDGSAVRASNADRTPVKRNGQPEDFVGAVVYLSSDSSAFTTGANIVVDGGWSVW